MRLKAGYQNVNETHYYKFQEVKEEGEFKRFAEVT